VLQIFLLHRKKKRKISNFPSVVITEQTMNQLKTTTGILVDVQTSRPVTEPGCQKTGAPYTVIGLYMILDIWGRNDQTNIALSPAQETKNKK
jgi:hypothetical protein